MYFVNKDGYTSINYLHDKYIFLNYLISNKLNLLKKELKKYIVKSKIDKGAKISYFLKVEDKMC